MVFQQSWRSTQRCWALVGCFFFTLRSNSSQTISVGFRLGDCGGQVIWRRQHSITLILGPIVLWGHCPVEKQIMIPLSANQMGWGSNLDSSDQSTDFHWSNIHSLCFLAQAFFFFLFFLSSGFFAAIRPWRPDSHSLFWTVDVERCLLLELFEACVWALIWGAVNWLFLRLVTVVNLSSAAEVTFCPHES